MNKEQEKVYIFTKIFDEEGEQLEETIYETIIRER
ncbi:MAG: hypothetical protein PWP27_1308 [Clostridiales bacterium]|jgi:hypothetical protein|nr:hypothetical protein [Clostridiales bacterium]MDK2933498.1 hypothetical protein [Clostridiales bacterium]